MFIKPAGRGSSVLVVFPEPDIALFSCAKTEKKEKKQRNSTMKKEIFLIIVQ